MIVLRAIALAVLLVGWAGPAFAQTPLAKIDSQLNSLCRRLPKASPAEAVEIRAQLGRLWRERASVLDQLPPARRAAVQHASVANKACLELAEQAAAPSRVKKAMKKASKNGGSGGAVTMRGKTLQAPGGSDGSSPSSGGMSTRMDPAGGSAPPAGRAPASAVPPMTAPPPGVPMAPGTTVVPTISAPQLEEFFPWPPPAPSDRSLLQLAQLGGDAPAKTWGDVADRIKALLRNGHFSTWGFYSAPGGFAVIPHLEQLDDQTGKALAGDARWASDVRLASLNLFQRIATVRLPKGMYRAIVFVLTNDPRTSGEITDPVHMLQIARRWGTSGAIDLPQALRRNSISDDQRLFVLLYEFESEVGGKTTVNTSARWSSRSPFDRCWNCYSAMTVHGAKSWLSIGWLAAVGPLVIILVLRQQSGFFGNDPKEVWNWFSQFVLPALTLLGGAWTVSASPNDEKRIDNPAIFWIAVILYSFLSRAALFSRRQPGRIVAAREPAQGHGVVSWHHPGVRDRRIGKILHRKRTLSARRYRHSTLPFAVAMTEYRGVASRSAVSQYVFRSFQNGVLPVAAVKFSVRGRGCRSAAAGDALAARRQAAAAGRFRAAWPGRLPADRQSPHLHFGEPFSARGIPRAARRTASSYSAAPLPPRCRAFTARRNLTAAPNG